jgi:hypothetical protein
MMQMRAKRGCDAPANMESMLKSWLVAPRPALLLMALESASANYRHSEQQAAKYSKKSTKQLQTQSCPYLKCHLPPTLPVLKSRKREVAKVAPQRGITEPVTAASHTFVQRHCCRRLSTTHFVAVRSQRNNSVQRRRNFSRQGLARVGRDAKTVRVRADDVGDVSALHRHKVESSTQTQRRERLRHEDGMRCNGYPEMGNIKMLIVSAACKRWRRAAAALVMMVSKGPFRGSSQLQISVQIYW